MESFTVLTSALDYIETNLTDNISQGDIARHCSYSVSSLQKMFKRVFHIGIADYIGRRRITAASKDLLSTDDNILDIALRYGYNSHEVFSRAFTRIWGEDPIIGAGQSPSLGLYLLFCSEALGDTLGGIAYGRLPR